MEKIYQVFDRTFKRIFALSDLAIINLINGLFCTNYPPDSRITYENREATKRDLTHRFADVFLTIHPPANHDKDHFFSDYKDVQSHHYHLEAQMYYDKTIVIRVFEYGLWNALETRDNDYTLHFPEPVIIYLDEQDHIPPESTLNIHFPGLPPVTYKVKNYAYLDHDVVELNRRKMVVLIPFQVLRLRNLLYTNGFPENFSLTEFEQLKDIVQSDILGSIEANLMVGNITSDDASQLIELASHLYEQIVLLFQEKGGTDTMKPLLPGALELPNDKYRMRIDELEAENLRLTDRNSELSNRNSELSNKNSELTDRNSELSNKNSELSDENSDLSREVSLLKARIKELEKTTAVK